MIEASLAKYFSWFVFLLANLLAVVDQLR